MITAALDGGFVGAPVVGVTAAVPDTAVAVIAVVDAALIAGAAAQPNKEFSTVRLPVVRLSDSLWKSDENR